ncbi:hypothetical protein CVT26_015042, partial [Gymnopilus dilepis]
MYYYYSTSEWPRRQYNGTPYPHNTQLPTSAGPGWAPSGGVGGGAPAPGPGWPTTPLTAPPMNTAHSWAYGQGTSTPNSPWHTPAWGQTRETGWGAHTPGGAGGTGGGAWGAAPPQSPYVPWGQPSPYTAPAGVPPASPYDSASGQPITGGWFGTGGAAAAAAATGGGGGWGGGVWQDGVWIAEKKHKKRRSDHGHGHGGFGHERHHDSDSEEPNYFGRSTSMRRTHSNRASPRRSKSLQRSASWGNANANGYANANANGAWGGWTGGGWWGDTPPQYAQNDLFDAHNLARRPRDWRPDYSPRGGLGAYIPKIGNKSWTTVKEWSDPVRRSLHPLLAHDPANPPIYYDLRSPTFDPRDVSFLNLPSRRAANQIDFAQLALQPSSAFMRIFHPKLPWYIDVSQSHPNGVTVFDVLGQMHAQLHASIHPRHFWNEELGEAERGVLTRTFQERV